MRLKDDEFVRCKDVGEISHGVSYTPNDLRDSDDGVLILRACNIQDSTVAFEDNVYVDAKCVDSSKMLRKGDILICGTNGSLRLVGKSAVVPSNDCGAFGSFMLRLRVNGNSQFVQYQLSALVDRYRGLFSTVTINQLTATQLATMKFWWPSEKTQRRIVGYLDEKTAAIDERVVVLEKKLAAYKRLKTSVINEAVTGRVDVRGRLSHGATETRRVSGYPSTNSVSPCLCVREMKDSGVDWIGKVPAEWSVRRVKDLVNCLDGRRIPVDSALREDGPYPYWGAGSIQGHVKDFIFDEELVLLGEDGAPFFDKERPVSFLVTEKIWVNNHIHVLKPVQIDSRFLVYCLNMVDYTNFVTGAIIQKLTQERMNRIHIPYPPLSEQRAIADYLDAECAKIDKMAALVTREIELNKKLKRSLINEVVTGKREVA